MPRTEEANQEIRRNQHERILKAAQNVFARKGKSATMADIAAEAGVSQGLAYRYFSNKEAILTALVTQAAQSGGGPAERIQQMKGTPGMRLALLVSYILEDRRVNPGFSQLLNQIINDDKIPSDLKQIVIKNGKIIQDFMRQLIIEGQATGEIANDDPDQLIVALLASFDGLMKRASMLDLNGNKKYFPDAKIILRMLKPDQQGVS